jgi:hypothetical protein
MFFDPDGHTLANIRDMLLTEEAAARPRAMLHGLHGQPEW